MPNLISILQDRSIHHPHQIAYLFLEDGKQEAGLITYGELDTKARAIAAFLQENQLSGERLLLLYRPGLDFISAFLGCLYAGVIAVPVHCPQVEDFDKACAWLNTVAQNAKIIGVLTTHAYLDKVEENFAELNKIILADTSSIDAVNAEKYQPLSISDEAIAYLQYSSGSTSTPKAAIIQHKNLMYSVKSSAQAWHYSSKSITLTWAPQSHVFGLVCGLLVPLCHGTPAIIMPPEAFIRRPMNWLEAISKYRVTHSGCPNFGYELCLREIKAADCADLNLKSWHVAINGGEKVQQETLVKFSEKFSPYGFHPKSFCSAYGMSEFAGTIAASRYGKGPVQFNLDIDKLEQHEAVFAKRTAPARQFMGNGHLLPGLHALIVDPETFAPLGKDKIGEIWLRGESLITGYWAAPEETKNSFVTLMDDVYFRTGDLGFIHKGEICLTGRLKEIIVLHGKKYYPLDLEISAAHALNDYPVGHSHVAFSTLIADKEEVIFLQEIPENLLAATQQDIIHVIRSAITKEHGIDLFDVVLIAENSLPKTVSGKLQRKLCKELFLENKLTRIISEVSLELIEAPAPTHAMQEFMSLVASVLKIDPTEISLAVPISTYHFDSISITQLASLLNDIYHLTMTPANFFEYATLGDCFNDVINKNNNNENWVPGMLPLQNNADDIAIIGMNGVLPGATDLNTFWDNLIQGKDCINGIPQERADFAAYLNDANSKIKSGGFIDEIAHFDAAFFNMSPREAELTDPQQRIFLQTVWKTIEDAGYSTAALASLKTGLFVGVFNNDYAELLQKNNISDAYITTGTTHSILANRVSYLLNLHGPSEAIDTACSSSLVAIHHAIQAIRSGDCQIAIAGGVNALLSPSPYLAANKAGMLSTDGRCKTFDKAANGYVRAEGVAAILLKPLSQALADGDHIYGVIKACAVNHGGLVSSLTVPNPVAQADVIATACRRAQIGVDTISYIEAHGTGTSLGDPIEINGIKNAFALLSKEQNTVMKRCGIGSVKTHIGHLEAAAGIAGIVKVLLAMKHKTLPGNLHFTELNPYIELTESPFYIVNQTQPWLRVNDNSPLRAGVSSFGFGGTNAHVILEEAPLNQSKISEQQQPYLIALSAKTETALKQQVQNLYHWLTKQTAKPSLAAISYTLNMGRTHFDKRCILVAESIEELQMTLQLANQNHAPDNFIINLEGNNTSKTRPIFNELFKLLSKEVHSATGSEYRNKLLALGNFYTEGYELDWNQLHRGEKKRISLITYPFAKDYYWIPKNDAAPAKHLAMTVSLQDEIIQTVSTLLKLPAENINVTAALSELGFDSIAFKELATHLESRYQIELSPAIFYTYQSIQALSDYLQLTYAEQMNTPVVAAEKVNFTSSTASHDAIAIIGMQAYLPQSNDLNEFWEHLVAEHDLVNEIPSDRWDWREYYGDSKQQANKTNSKWGACIADVDKFDAGFFNISAREANLMDPQHRLFMEIVWKTIEDAGYDPLALPGQDVGLFAGIEFSEYQTLIHAQHKSFHGHLATGTSHAMLANRISYFLNLQGPSEVVDTACSSSLVAIHRAVNALRQGECSLAIAGGVSLMLNPDTFVITSQLGALSPDGRCKTFDKSANGYVKGEGVAAVLLKPLQKALQDGDQIYGLIKGTAVNHGGKAQSLTAPNAATQSQLLQKAYAQANVDMETVSYIEAHGTGTELGDPIEIEGLKLAFSHTQKKSFCGLGSVKTNIGHLEPASGVVGLIKVMLAMQHGKMPGTLHFTELNPYINLTNSPFYIVEKTASWQRLKDNTGAELQRRAGISSFGFGGTCAHVVVEEAPTQQQHIRTQHKSFYIVTLSAKLAESLQQRIVDLHEWLKINFSKTNLESLSYTLNCGRSQFTERCAIVVNSLEELLNSLQALRVGQTPVNCVVGNTKDQVDNSNLSDSYHSAIETIKNYASVPPTEYRQKMLIIANLYIKNYPIDWSVLHAGEKHQRQASLPTYPLIKQRYWFDADSSAPTQAPNLVVNSADFTLSYLQQIFAEKLQIAAQQIDADATYEVYGVDSLIGLEITNRLEQDFGTLPKTLLYERSYLRDLADFFQKKFADVLQKMQGNLSSTQAAPAAVIKIEKVKAEKTTDDIAIIGITGTFPLANNLDEFWENLQAGRNCITEVPGERWNYKDHPVSVGGEEKYFKHGGFIEDIDKFDALFFGIAPREASLMDPQERLFLQSAWSTLEDAGYTRESLQRNFNNEVGVFAGVTYNFYPLFVAEEWHKGNKIPLDIQMFSVANRVSYFLNLKGPSYVIDTACSSSLAAIHLACESILRGECEMAIAGGVNLSLHPTKYHFLGSYSFMSDQGRCASFAEGGAGYVPGEGVATVLLKPLALAIRDNDRIYGVIKSSSMNHGGKTSGYTVPNPNAQAELIKTALTKASIDPRSISYVEAHGTGTSLGDPIEVRGLQQAFEEFTQDKQYCAIGSVKSNIGHLESAAGVSQLAKVLLQLKHKKLVPSLHAEKLNPFIDFAASPFFVQRELGEWNPVAGYPRRAAISSFGAGGTNVHLIVDEYAANEIAQPRVDIRKPFIFVLSALNAERLHEYVEKMIVYLTAGITKDDSDAWLSQLCYTLQSGRESMTARLAIVAESADELLQICQRYHAQPDAVIANGWMNPSAQHPIAEENIAELIQQSRYTQLAQLWVNGAKIDWSMLYNQSLQKMALPTYPFAKRRCWVPTAASPVQSTPVVKAEIEALPPENINDWLYTTRWEKASNQQTPVSFTQEDHWLILSDKELGFILQDELGKTACTYCFPADEFQQTDQNAIYINADKYEDYVELFSRIYEDYENHLKGIIYLWPTNEESQQFSSGLRLVHLFKALQQQKWQHKLRFCLVTRGAQPVNEQDEVQLWQHHLWSLVRIFAAEQGDYQVLLLDLAAKKQLREEAQFIANELRQYDLNDNQLAYRDRERHAIRLLKEKEQPSQAWYAPAAAIVTGGLGALGSEVVKCLAKQGTKHFLLIGSSPLPDQSDWSRSHDAATQEKIDNMISLQDLSVDIHYAAVDVRDKEKMQAAIHAVEAQWNTPITGVFHLAGITTDSITIDKMTDELFEKVLSVKINGALVLHELFNKPEVNCFVLFSSIAALPFFGMSGLSAYAMANEFLNGLAALRRHSGLSGMSINWAAWADKGMSFRYNHSHFLEAVGMSTIAISTGLEILLHLLTYQPVNVTVFKVQWTKFLLVNAAAKKLGFFAHFVEQRSANYTQQAMTFNHEQVAEIVSQSLANLLQLEPAEIDPNTPYLNYGLDSIIGINFVAKLGESFPDVVSPMDLYRYPNVNQLISFILQSCQTADAPAVEIIEDNEQKLMEEIAHLTDDQLRQLLEDEIANI